MILVYHFFGNVGLHHSGVGDQSKSQDQQDYHQSDQGESAIIVIFCSHKIIGSK